MCCAGHGEESLVHNPCLPMQPCVRFAESANLKEFEIHLSSQTVLCCHAEGGFGLSEQLKIADCKTRIKPGKPLPTTSWPDSFTTFPSEKKNLLS